MSVISRVREGLFLKLEFLNDPFANIYNSIVRTLFLNPKLYLQLIELRSQKNEVALKALQMFKCIYPGKGDDTHQSP